MKINEPYWERLEAFELLAKAAYARRGNTFVVQLQAAGFRYTEQVAVPRRVR